MLVTEEEAKGKWCPHSRTVKYDVGTMFSSSPRNRVVESEANEVLAEISYNLAGCQCIASQCMAWRWSEQLMRTDGPVLPRTGYCGLAGRVD